MPSAIRTYIAPVLRPSCGLTEGAATTDDTLPFRYIRLAAQTLADAGVEGVDASRLSLIVRAAVSARDVLFSAMLHEPTEWELDEFFEDFIHRCVIDLDALEAR